MKSKKTSARGEVPRIARVIRRPGVITLEVGGSQADLVTAVEKMAPFFPDVTDFKRMKKDLCYRVRSVVLGKDYVKYSQIPPQVFADMLEYLFFHQLGMYGLLRAKYDSVDCAFFNSPTLSRLTVDGCFKKGCVVIPKELTLDALFYGSIDLTDVETGEALPPEAFTEPVSVSEKTKVQKGDELVFTDVGVFRFEYLFAQMGDKGSNFTPKKVYVTPVTNEKLLRWTVLTPRMPLSLLFRLKNKVQGLEHEVARQRNFMDQQCERILGILGRINRHDVPAMKKK